LNTGEVVIDPAFDPLRGEVAQYQELAVKLDRLLSSKVYGSHGLFKLPTTAGWRRTHAL